VKAAKAMAGRSEIKSFSFEWKDVSDGLAVLTNLVWVLQENHPDECRGMTIECRRGDKGNCRVSLVVSPGGSTDDIEEMLGEYGSALQETHGDEWSSLDRYVGRRLAGEQEAFATVRLDTTPKRGGLGNVAVGRLMYLARLESETLGQDFIGTEHLLLALVREPEGPVKKVFSMYTLDYEKIKAELENHPPDHGGQPPLTGRKLTPEASSVVAATVREALKMKSGPIGGEHLLLAMLNEKNGPVGKVLSLLGTEPEKIRCSLLAIMCWRITSRSGTRSG